MASIFQILRRIGGVKAPPTNGSAGQLAMWKAGTAPADAFELYAHDGVQWFPMLPEMLIAARSYYVATTGSDTNDGLTAATPFKTIQHAVDTVRVAGAIPGVKVTVNIADGTYPEAVSVSKLPVDAMYLTGNTTNPSAVQIAPATGKALAISGSTVNAGGIWFKSVDNSAVMVGDYGTFNCTYPIEISCSNKSVAIICSTYSHMDATRISIHFHTSAFALVQGSFKAHMAFQKPFILDPGMTLSYGVFYLSDYSYAEVLSGFAVTGAFTGRQFYLTTNSTIAARAHQPETIFGGSLPGYTSIGGQYVPGSDDNFLANVTADEGTY